MTPAAAPVTRPAAVARRAHPRALLGCAIAWLARREPVTGA